MTLVAQTVVSLGKGVCFPATAMSQLYVRQSYVDILDADQAYRDCGEDVLLTYVTGTPGIHTFKLFTL